MDRREAARVLLEIARMLELSGANPFKVRAYENAAQALLAFRETSTRPAPPRVPG